MAQPTSRSLWHLVESIAVAMAQGYGLARVRATIFFGRYRARISK